MKLRGKLLLAFLCAAFVPFLALGALVQQTLIANLRESHTESALLQIAHARSALEATIDEDRRAVRALCTHDLVVDRLLLDLAGDRFGPTQEQRLVELLPPMMRGRRFDSLLLLDASTGPTRGRVLGAGHFPAQVGSRDPSLVDAVSRRGEEAFVADLRSRQNDGSLSTVPNLVSGCTVARDGAAVAVVAGRRLDAHTSGLGPSDAISLELGDAELGDAALGSAAPRAAEPGEAGPDLTEVHTFIDASGEATTALFARTDNRSLDAEVASLEKRSLVIALVALAGALLGAILLSWRLSQSFVLLEEAAAQVGAGDLESQLPVPRGEASSVMTAFNRMTKELAATQQKLIRAERNAAWREVARRIAHEIKNPLQPIQMEVETLRKLHQRKHPSFDEDFPASTQVILDEVRRMNAMVTEFSRFARLPAPRPQNLDLNELVAHVVGLHPSAQWSAPGAPSQLRGDRDQLVQVLLNLVQNATEAAEARHGSEGARVEIDLAKDDDAIELRIADNGPGISPEERLRIFEPYFTTKAKGTGLGLAIVQRIVADHDGDIEIEDGIDGGSCFRLRLPIGGPAGDPMASTLGEAPVSLERRR